ncbi:MAG: tRNA-dihydrouridine synthase, partial [Gammaproteobacteria bacterium]|nr:tRNA-dihydrouridine synthase [Gammaproteobacteria bacterium]
RDYYHDDHPIPSRIEIIEKYLPFVEQQLADGIALNHMTRHLMGIFQGQPNSRLWRRYLSEHATKPYAGIEVIGAALDIMRQGIV